MHATIGRIVHYSLTEFDIWDNVEDRPNVNAHVPGQLQPAIVVAVIKEIKGKGEVVNLQVFLDGKATAWVQGAYPGEEPGQWRWPAREPDEEPGPETRITADGVKEIVSAAIAAVTPPTA